MFSEKIGKENIKTIGFGLFMLLFGIILFIAAQTIKAGAEMGRGADFLPKLISGGMGICGALIIISEIFVKKQRKDSSLPTRRQMLNFLCTFFLLLFYVLLLSSVGFLIMTTLYIFLQSWIITPKQKFKPGKLVLIAGVSSAAIYGTFVFGLSLMLPAGILG
jgi:putative tricarboxylic transport membrane protein